MNNQLFKLNPKGYVRPKRGLLLPKATVLPFITMNCRITEFSLRAVCRELAKADRAMSHRALRQVLRSRFGATGKTARVLRIWREELAHSTPTIAAVESHLSSHPTLPTEVIELQERLRGAEARSAKLLQRAELSELRAVSHQDRWLLEIDRLRQQLLAQPNYAREVRTLQNTVTRLTVELAALRGGAQAGRVG